MKYRGKYSLKENLFRGRGMGLLKENTARQEQAVDAIGVREGRLEGSNGVSIEGITGSNPGIGQQLFNKKASITDVQFETGEGKVNISCKGENTPGSASGNKEILLRTIGRETLNKAAAAFSAMIKEDGVEKGERVSGYQALVKVPDDKVGDLLRGSEAEGGPIDYFYKGPMNVGDLGGGKVDGKLETPDEYAASSGDFYLLLRQKANNQVFLDDLSDKDRSGVSLVLGQSEGQANTYNGFRIDVKSDADASTNLGEKILTI